MFTLWTEPYIGNLRISQGIARYSNIHCTRFYLNTLPIGTLYETPAAILRHLSNFYHLT